MQTSEVVIQNEQGLHARPAAIFISEANKFKSNILITKGNATVNAKSIMGVMALSVSKGEKVSLRAEGVDEREAVESLSQMLEKEKIDD